MAVIADHPAKQTDAAILTKAVLRAAFFLDLRGRELAAMLGVSEATLSRMRKGDVALEAGGKPFELGVLFVRLFRSLDAIVGGDATVARAWLRHPNDALGARPIEKLVTIAGLVDVLAYLDARRARL